MTKTKLKHSTCLYIITLTNRKRLVDQKIEAPFCCNYSIFEKNSIWFAVMEMALNLGTSCLLTTCLTVLCELNYIKNLSEADTPKKTR